MRDHRTGGIALLEQSDKLNLQYGMGRKMPGKLFLLSYFGEVMNAVGDSEKPGINSEYQSPNAAKKNKGDFKQESVFE